MEKDTHPKTVFSVLKLFNILQELGKERGIGANKLSKKLLISRSATYKILQTAKSLGFVEQSGDADEYYLTYKLFEIGSHRLEYFDIVDIAYIEMKNLVKQLNETVHLGKIENNSVVCLHREESSHDLRTHYFKGQYSPIYCTATGKILISNMHTNDIKTLLKRTNLVKYTVNTYENIDQLINEIKTVKKQCFSEDIEEKEIGLRCISVPIFNRFGTLVNALSVSIPTARFDDSKKKNYIELLHDSGRKISKKLGFKNYPI